MVVKGLMGVPCNLCVGIAIICTILLITTIVPTSEDEDVSEDPQCTLPEDNQCKLWGGSIEQAPTH